MLESTSIESVRARKIYNGRGEETLEVEVLTLDGFGRSSAPSGKSRGREEAIPYPGDVVDAAVVAVHERIGPELEGLHADEQGMIDLRLHELDGTRNFSSIGGNTACAVSFAVADAAAATIGIPLCQHLGGPLSVKIPTPLGNILCGGKHAGKNTPDIQEFLVLPIGATSFAQAAKANFTAHAELGGLLSKIDPHFTGGRGDEGAWAPHVDSTRALEALSRICEMVSDRESVRLRPCLDMAASSLWNEKEEKYEYVNERTKRDRGEQIEYTLELISTYGLAYVEDPLMEEDFEGFAELTKKAKGCLICGDDLFVTAIDRLQKGIALSSARAVIVKPNQIGTISDARETAMVAMKNGYVPVISHRSGEGCDSTISHLAVAFGCPIIKCGVVGGERTAKINELIRIEETLGHLAKMSDLTIISG